MTKNEWKYLKSLEKGRKHEAYQTLPVSKPIWKQPTAIVLTIYLIGVLVVKMTLKHY